MRGRLPLRAGLAAEEDAAGFRAPVFVWGELAFADAAPVFFPGLPAGFSFKEFKIGLQR